MREEVRKARKQYELARRNRKVKADSVCKRCGMTQAQHEELGRGSLQLHHIVPLSEGGHPTDPENLITLCAWCHKDWHQFAEELGATWDEWWPLEPLHFRFWKR